MTTYNVNDVERIELGTLVKVSVNFPVKMVVDIDTLRGEFIPRPSFIKIAVDRLIKDMKKTKKNILDYANESL